MVTAMGALMYFQKAWSKLYKKEDYHSLKSLDTHSGVTIFETNDEPQSIFSH